MRSWGWPGGLLGAGSDGTAARTCRPRSTRRGCSCRWRRSGAGLCPAIGPSKLYRHAGFVTEDRRGEGLFLNMSVGDNVVVPPGGYLAPRAGAWGRAAAGGGSNDRTPWHQGQRAEDRRVQRCQEAISRRSCLRTRWLPSAPKLLLLDEPTRGFEYRRQDRNFAAGERTRRRRNCGAGGFVRLEELTRACDRYLVMVRGRIVSELPPSATRETLVNALSPTMGRVQPDDNGVSHKTQFLAL